MGEQIFIELSLIIVITVAIAALAKILKQPLIIAYIIAGLVLSPYGLDLVSSHDSIETFSQLGIAFLLFMVGINLNPQIIKTVGKISIITGLGQIIFTSLIGFAIGILLGFSSIEALYIAVAMTFSSTIVIMKLLYDKKDLDTLYGKIAIGFLIIQDIVAMIILLMIASISTYGNLSSALLESLIKSIGALAIVFVLGKYILPRVFKKFAQSVELLMLSSIAWCFALASVFYSIGLSIEIGALLAGVSLSMSPYRSEISSRIRPLRDFFLLMFFVFLGTQLQFNNFEAYIIPIIVFSLFILIGNPLIVIILMSIFRYTKKTSFLAGLTVAQISEFSIILIALGIKTGHINQNLLSFVTVTGLITIGASTYFIIYGKKLYKILAKYLSIFERKGEKVDGKKNVLSNRYSTIIIGYNNMGEDLTKTLKKMRKKFLVVDYDPEVIHKLTKEKIQCIYSDIEDENIFEAIDFKKIKLVVSTIKSPETNLDIIDRIRKVNPESIVVVVAEGVDDAFKCYEHGATYVIMPHFLGGHHVSALIEHFGLDNEKFTLHKNKHLKQLRVL